MKRKIVYSLLICLGVLFGGVVSVNAATTDEDCFGFDKDTATITNYKNDRLYCNTNNIIIPETIDGVKVERIGARAFMYDYLDSVVIPNGIKVIGNLAFFGNELKTINIPDSVTKIGYAAFNNNNFDETQYIYDRTDNNNDGVAEIDNTKLVGVAGTDDISTLKFPSNITTIKSNALYGILIEDLYLTNITNLENKALDSAYINVIHDIPSDVNSNAFNINVKKFPFLDVIYFRWMAYDSNDNFLGNNYQKGASTLVSDMYLNPTTSWLEASAIAYNKIMLEYEDNYSVDETDIYKYNPNTKRYEKYMTTTRSSDITISKGINPGQTYYFKISSCVKTPEKRVCSPLSDAVSIRTSLSIPTNVKAKKYKSGIAKITWKKVPGANGYSIYKYNAKTKKYVIIKNTKSLYTTTSYQLKKGAKAYYKVRAYKMVNGKKVYSNYSKQVSVRV